MNSITKAATHFSARVVLFPGGGIPLPSPCLVAKAHNHPPPKLQPRCPTNLLTIEWDQPKTEGGRDPEIQLWCVHQTSSQQHANRPAYRPATVLAVTQSWDILFLLAADTLTPPPPPAAPSPPSPLSLHKPVLPLPHMTCAFISNRCLLF